MIVCVPVTTEATIDPRWGRANRVAVAELVDGIVKDWREYEVGWGELHDQGTEGSHHARIAKFLREHQVSDVLADHMGEGMQRMLRTMGITFHPGAQGDARRAVHGLTTA